MENGLHVFRVRTHIQKARLTSSARADVGPAPSHDRRPHTKSRHGCETCRQCRKKVRVPNYVDICDVDVNIGVVRRTETNLYALCEK
jgi:hypothetical protein